MDDQHVRGVFTNGNQTVSADLVFDDVGDLIDFVSHDRLRASTDGTSFSRQTWSTPLSGHREELDRRLVASGQGRWHTPAPGGAFTYVEMHFDDITYNVHNGDVTENPLSAPSL